MGVVRPATDPVIGLLQHLPVAAGFGLLIWAAAAGTGPVLRVLGWRPFTGLGVVSYGVFLWHLPIMLAVNRITHLPGPVLALVTLVLTVPVAIVSWRALERPAPAQRAGRAGNTVRERTPSLA
jgi:peptidoglycan/LPS O-acetylase OafA/YrhL